MRLVLEIRSGPAAGRSLTVEFGQSVTIGRTARANAVVSEDSHMSGLHFVVESVSQGWVLRDLNSTNGTFLNGAKVGSAPLAHGDTITAGQTSFFVNLSATAATVPLSSAAVTSNIGPLVARVAQPAIAPPAAVPAAQAEVPTVELTPQAKLLAMLRKDFQPLYALLDAAIEPDVLKVLYESKAEFQSLYEGPQGAQLAHFAPYLVRLPAESPLLEILATKGWGKNWGVYLTCSADLPTLRRHLRHFLMVELPDGKRVYFRFYDPRVLRVYLPTCNADELKQFYGPVKCYLMEDENPQKLLRFVNAGEKADKQETSLTAPDPANQPHPGAKPIPKTLAFPEKAIPNSKAK